MQWRTSLTRNESGLVPVEFFVVVALPPQEEKTAGGIILPSAVQDKDKLATQEGTLVAASPLASFCGVGVERLSVRVLSSFKIPDLIAVPPRSRARSSDIYFPVSTIERARWRGLSASTPLRSAIAIATR